ncbi:MAG: DNA-3-methyladenine glycosylase I [Calditrichaeota bacterium]|nr:DNA-3-methyladenine glycosylase I [Calditrichota bacterium]
MNRCGWCGDDPLYVSYHDNEWGVPLKDDQALFEFLILEGMQAGLSWITILRKRENFRKAFAQFDPLKVAAFTENDYNRLMQDAGIIRNQLKIRAAINNAQRFLETQKEYGSFANYIWSFVDHQPVINKWKAMKEIPAKTDLSDRISKDMIKRGYKFVGSTIIYSHMQATGMVNDHTTECFRYNQLIG